MQKLGTEQRRLLADATEIYNLHLIAGTSPCSTSALEYLAGRGLDGLISRYQLGVVAEPRPGHERMAGRVSIPYLTPAGVIGIKFRCTEHDDCKAHKCPKYLYSEGGSTFLFNARAVLAARASVVICEGEFDAMAVSGLAGIPAVGYPGADTWARNEHWPRVFAGLEVVVVADGDAPGLKAAQTVAKSIPDSRLVVLPDGEDSNSLILKEGPGAFRERCVL